MFRFRSFRIQFILISTIVLVIALGIMGTLFYSWTLNRFNQDLGNRLLDVAAVVANVIPASEQEQLASEILNGQPGYKTRPGFVKTRKALERIQAMFGPSTNIYTAIVNPTDPNSLVVITSSGEDNQIGLRLAMTSVTREVLTSGKAQRSEVLYSQRADWISTAAPIQDSDGKVKAILGIDTPISTELKEGLAEIKWAIILCLFASGFASIAIGHLLSRFLVNPIRDLSRVALAVGQGDLSARVQIRGHDEIAQLGETFNSMVSEMGVARQKLMRQAIELEDAVQERTKELEDTQHTIRAMVDSLNEGFLIFDSSGTCRDVSSSNCETILEGRPNRRPIAEVLRIADAERTHFDRWVKMLFGGKLSFEDAAPLGPKLFPHSKNQYITLSYYPVWSPDHELQGVVVVASDRTQERKHQEQAREKERRADFVLKAAQMGQALDSFFVNAEKDITKLRLELADIRNSTLSTYDLVSMVHTLKGEASIFSLDATAGLAHELEDSLREYERHPTPEHERRLANKIAALQENLLESRMLFYDINLKSGGPDLAAIREQRLKLVELVMYMNELGLPKEVRVDLLKYGVAQQVGWFFSVYTQFAQDVAIRLGKKISPLQFENADLPVYAEPYHELFRTIVHLIRNSLDHGIEMPRERLARNKPESGTIHFKFERFPTVAARWYLRITISDDGEGISVKSMRERLRSLKGDYYVDAMADDQVLQQIFDPGFSTKSQVSELSGRGIGLSAVKQECFNLGGDVRVESEQGSGTKFVIEVPDSYDELINPVTRLAS